MLSAMSPWLDAAASVYGPGGARVEDAGLAATVSDWLADWEDGRIKLFVTACGLRLRREKPRLFLEGDYVPLATDGAGAHRLVAFARRHGSDLLVAVTPRLTSSLTTPERPLPIGIDVWLNTRVVLPEELGRLTLGNVLTGETNTLLDNGRQALLAIVDVFRTCPVALLWARPA
jgi:(1->4)-alpha-D-glucan 1-alpha-D-glucosylmutase